MSIYLDQKLEKYSKSDYYPFHMPGHKRMGMEHGNPYKVDITEIEGFDNLHHAQGILKEAQQRAADLYGARQSFYLVNGSTCGILAAISSSVSFGGKILMARNSHKAAYHGVLLRHLNVEYLYPQVLPIGIQGAITPTQVEAAWKERGPFEAVFLTSPTYDGVVSDIEKIAEIVHAHGAVLIVDEAHGAHFGFGTNFPDSAVKKGADLVIQSLHKTLPSFTQTALLHIGSDRVETENVQRYLGIYQTSSPSYVLMEGMDRCIRLMQEQAEEKFAFYERRLERFYEETADLKQLHIMNRTEAKQYQKEGRLYDWDYGKILIFTEKSNCSGEKLYERLLEEYHLQMEMCTPGYVTAMTSIMDTTEGFIRLIRALHAIDATLMEGDETGIGQRQNFIQQLYRPLRAAAPMYEAMERKEIVKIPMHEAEGKISTEFVYLYPPGIPIVVPGEQIEDWVIERVEACRCMGLRVEGLRDVASEYIYVEKNTK